MKTSVRHKKSGNIYDILYEDVFDCTNVDSHCLMVVYTREHRIFAREKSEFWEKFERFICLVEEVSDG